MTPQTALDDTLEVMKYRLYKGLNDGCDLELDRPMRNRKAREWIAIKLNELLVEWLKTPLANHVTDFLWRKRPNKSK